MSLSFPESIEVLPSATQVDNVSLAFHRHQEYVYSVGQHPVKPINDERASTLYSLKILEVAMGPTIKMAIDLIDLLMRGFAFFVCDAPPFVLTAIHMAWCLVKMLVT